MEEPKVVDFSGSVKALELAGVAIDLLRESGEDLQRIKDLSAEEPDAVFYLVAEAFDDFREAYVSKGDVGQALQDLIVAAVVAKGV